MKKRIIIGIILIVIAFVLCFVLSPFIQSKSNGNKNVIRCKQNIEKGKLITKDDIEQVSVGIYNLQNNILTNENDIIGKYASSNIYKYDYFTKEKLSSTKENKENSMFELGTDKYAYTINVSSLASGVGNTLGYGDIVSCICNENGRSFIPIELKYLKVLSLTNSQGQDYELEGKGMYSCITFECTEEECILLSEYSQRGHLSFMLVCKYDSQAYKELGF